MKERSFRPVVWRIIMAKNTDTGRPVLLKYGSTRIDVRRSTVVVR